MRTIVQEFNGALYRDEICAVTGEIQFMKWVDCHPKTMQGEWITIQAKKPA